MVTSRSEGTPRPPACQPAVTMPVAPEDFEDALELVVEDARARVARRGVGHVMGAECVICEGRMVFVEDSTGVEFVGSVTPAEGCLSHWDGRSAMDRCYNLRAARWVAL